MTAPACATPVSWLLLERHALGELPLDRAARLTAHLDTCPTCRAALAAIQSDTARALPPLPDLAFARARRRQRSRRWLAAGSATAAAAALLLYAAIRREPTPGLPGVKGGDALALQLIRERAGDIAHDPRAFRAGDRFKIVVTCADPAGAIVDVSVEQGGETFRPLEPTAIPCANAVPLPGAFRLTGDQPASICAEVRGGGARECRLLLPE